MKEIEEDTKKWEKNPNPCAWTGRRNIVKMSIPPKAIHIFNTIPNKITPAFFTELEQTILKSVWNQKQTMNSQSNPEKENQSWRHHNSRLQNVLQAVIIKTVWYWHKNRHSDQWNRIENPEMDPQTYGQLIFDKAGKNIQWKKDSLFNKWCWENWTATCRRMKLDHFLTPFTKINSKCIKDLNVRQEIIKTLEEKAGKTLSDLSCSNFLLDTSQGQGN